MTPDHYFFLHIPKTAGTTLHHRLAESVGPYLHLTQPQQFSWSAERVWQRFRGCGGHVGWEDSVRYGFMQAFSFTILRDPIERVLSQLSHSRSFSETGTTDTLRASASSLEDLLVPDALNQFCNAQTFALSSHSGKGVSGTMHLDSALANLESLSFIGFVESFDADFERLCRLLGGTSVTGRVRLNRNASRLRWADLSSDLKNIVTKSQTLDLELYQRARRLGHGKRTTAKPPRKADAGWPPKPSHIGTREVVVESIRVEPEAGETIVCGGKIRVVLQCRAFCSAENVSVGWRIEDQVGSYIAGSNSELTLRRRFSVQQGPFGVCVALQTNMGPGFYTFGVCIEVGDHIAHKIEHQQVFEVMPSTAPYREGLVDMPNQVFLGSGESEGPLPEEVARQIGLECDGSLLWELNSRHLIAHVSLLNKSGCVLPRQGARLAVSYHWLDENGNVLVHDGTRTSLPCDVFPGERITFPVTVHLPSSPGRRNLEIRMVQEGVRWHEGSGFESVVPRNLTIDIDASGHPKSAGPTHGPAGGSSTRDDGRQPK